MEISWSWKTILMSQTFNKQHLNSYWPQVYRNVEMWSHLKNSAVFEKMKIKIVFKEEPDQKK